VDAGRLAEFRFLSNLKRALYDHVGGATGMLVKDYPNLVFYGVDPYRKVVSSDFQQQRLIATLTSLFGVLGWCWLP